MTDNTPKRFSFPLTDQHREITRKALEDHPQGFMPELVPDEEIDRLLAR